MNHQWHRHPLRYLAQNLSIVIGLVLVWRGVWYTLDNVDVLLFGSSHTWTALGGIVLGFLILFIPDHDLKEIQKL